MKIEIFINKLNQTEIFKKLNDNLYLKHLNDLNNILQGGKFSFEAVNDFIYWYKLDLRLDIMRLISYETNLKFNFTLFERIKNAATNL